MTDCMQSLMDLAKTMAELDFKANGGYINAPYSLMGMDGQVLKAKVQSVHGETRLVLIQPETQINDCFLDNSGPSHTNGAKRGKKALDPITRPEESYFRVDR